MNMKKNLMSLASALLVMGAAVLSGCSDDDNFAGSTYQPSQKTLEAFSRDFKDATNVSWSQKNGYSIASFQQNSTRNIGHREPSTAWYPENTDRLYYSKIELTYDQLKDEAPLVAAYWEECNYNVMSRYTLDDIDKKVYTNKETLYKLEIETPDESEERELVLTQDGKLLSDRLDKDDNDIEDEACPEALLDFVTTKYPTAVIVDFDYEDDEDENFFEVEVVIDLIKYDLIFAPDFSFLHKDMEIDETNSEQLPEAVLNAFKIQAPDLDSWDDIIVREYPDGTVHYLLEVELEDDTEIVFAFNEDGTPVKQ